MSDRISRMANANPSNDLNRLLIETLRRHEQALHSLALDVAGLKALVTDEKMLHPFADRMKIFQDARETARGTDALAFEQLLNSLDEAIRRLRGT